MRQIKTGKTQTQIHLIESDIESEIISRIGANDRTAISLLTSDECASFVRSARTGLLIRDGQGNLLDAWGNPFTIEVRHGASGFQIVIESSGADEAKGTLDDLRCVLNYDYKTRQLMIDWESGL